MCKLQTVGLFAGIGGIELGLARAGHHAIELCEIDKGARAVLSARFPGVALVDDVRSHSSGLRRLPSSTSLLTAGFPCQDLSQAGKTAGIAGARSGLIDEVFDILDRAHVEWLLLENVPFMLHLGQGAAVEHILGRLERLEYKWAYRVVDTRSFGLPQRRERVFFLASREHDPRNVLYVDEAGEPPESPADQRTAYGFYWTEGARGLGWAIDAVPTSKGGSSIGIPSPPGVFLPDGTIAKIGIRDAERMQGFEPDWTAPVASVARANHRWKLVGNGVTVQVAEWIGRRLAAPGAYMPTFDEPLRPGTAWPKAAYNSGQGRFLIDISAWPKREPRRRLIDFLTMEDLTPLSLKATRGFLSRFEASSLKKPTGFLEALRAHRAKMEALELVAS